MADAKTTLRDIIGNDNTSNISGGIFTSIGLIGSLLALGKQKTYEEITRETNRLVSNVGTEFNAKADTEMAGLQFDLSAHGERTGKGIQQGLVNRGITEKAVGEQAAGQVQSGLSGAYAQARATLGKAKLTAGSAVSGAIANYQQALAKNQYESMLKKYYSQMGIWGSLAGGGAGLLATPGENKIAPTKIKYIGGAQDETGSILSPEDKG